MDLQALINSLLPIVGQEVVDQLTEQIDELSADQEDEFKALLLALVADAVEEHGPAGIDMAQDAINDLFDGKNPDIDWASPRTASDLVAAMQLEEAGRKAKAKDFFTKLGNTLAIISAAVVKGLIASA